MYAVPHFKVLDYISEGFIQEKVFGYTILSVSVWYVILLCIGIAYESWKWLGSFSTGWQLYIS